MLPLGDLKNCCRLPSEFTTVGTGLPGAVVVVGGGGDVVVVVVVLVVLVASSGKLTVGVGADAGLLAAPPGFGRQLRMPRGDAGEDAADDNNSDDASGREPIVAGCR